MSSVGLYIEPHTNYVGIGTSAPTQALDVKGTISASSVNVQGTIQATTVNVQTINATTITGNGAGLSNLPLPYSQWSDTTSNIYFLTGNVGIGTDIPQSKLHTEGSMYVSGDVQMTGTVYGGTQMFRNRVINGDMRIDQRNAGNAGAEYGPDRFQVIGTRNPMTVLPKQVALSPSDQATTGQPYATSLTVIPGPTNGLTTYLSFNDRNVIDVMGKLGTPSIVGSPQYVNGVVPNGSIGGLGRALYFANEANIAVTNTTSTNTVAYTYTVTGTISTSFWVQFTKLPYNNVGANTYNCVFSCGGGTTLQYGVFVNYLSGTTANLYVYANGGTSSGTTITIGVWYHVTSVWVPGSTVTLYVNGALIASIACASSAVFTNGTLMFGGNTWWNAGYYEPFAGYIDDFRIYNRALTSGEVALLAGVSPAITSMPDTNAADSGLVAYYRFEDNLNESSGAPGAPTLTPTGTMQYVTGVSGTKALYLANTPATTATNYLRNTTYVIPSSFTISTWANFTSFLTGNGQNAMIFTSTSGATSLTNAIWIGQYQGTIRAGFYFGSDITAVTLSTNTWYHIVVTHTNSILTIYVNGIFSGSTTGTFAQSGFILGNGYTADNRAFAGYIDDFRIYNRVLNAGEIAYLAGNGMYPSINNLNTTLNRAAHFPFDGNLTDVSGNSVALTATGTMNYVPGILGSQALYLANEANVTAGTAATNYVRNTTISFSSTIAFTASMWINITRFNGNNSLYFFSTNNGASALTNSVGMYVNTSKLSSDYWGVSSVVGTTILVANTWYHVVLTCTGTTSTIYLNGSREGTNNGTQATSTGFLLGNAYTTATIPFAGYIDDFRLYKGILTQSQISALYYGSAHNATPLTNLLNYTPVSSVVYQQAIEGTQVADLAFGDASHPTNPSVHYLFNGDISDVSGNGNTLTPTGSLSYVTGIKGQALYLANEANVTAGTIQANYVSSSYMFGTTFTICMWTYCTLINGSGVNSILFGTNTASTPANNTLWIRFNTSYGIDAGFYAGNALTSTPFTINTWYHLALTYNAGTITLFVNNKLISTTTGTLVQTGFMLGGFATSGNGAFAGYIDDFRIYNTVLNQDQITAIYTNSPLSSSPSPVTISCWLKNNTLASQQLSIALHNNYNRSAVYTTPTIATGTWRKVAFTIPGDTLGYWAKDTGTSMVLAVALGANSNAQIANVAAISGNTSNVWNSNVEYTGLNVQTYGDSNTFLIAPGNAVYVTGVQLEKGTIATPFEFRPMSTELVVDNPRTITIDQDSGNVGIGTTIPTSRLHVNGQMYVNSTLNVNGPMLSTGIYAQFNRASAQTFTGSGGSTWEAFQLDTVIYNSGISLNTTTNAITFTYPGAYFITVGFRFGGGSDSWTGVRLYGDGAEKGKSFGTGNITNDPGPAFFQMIAYISNTSTTYKLELWRNNASLAIATPATNAGHTIVSTYIRIG